MFAKKLATYIKLMRLHRPIGALLLLWPVFASLWINCSGLPRLPILITFFLGIIIVRSAGCVINDIADRKFDAFVERTKDRPIAAGSIKTKYAILVFIFLSISAWFLAKSLNVFASQLAIGAIIITIAYPWTKRFIYIPQLILGIAFSFGIVMASASTINHITPSTWILFLTNTIWSVSYDTQYAMMDEFCDKKIGIKSTAVLLGERSNTFINLLQCSIISLLIVIGINERMNVQYFLFLTISSFAFYFQSYIIKRNDSKSCYYAFLNNNFFGLVFFVGVILGVI